MGILWPQQVDIYNYSSLHTEVIDKMIDYMRSLWGHILILREIIPVDFHNKENLI